MNMHRLRMIVLAAWLGCVCSVVHVVAAEGGLEVEASEEGLLVREGGKKVLFFQRKAKSLEGRYQRAGYVHPLFDLSGDVVTEDFPEDHRHHRGIFWAWHQVYVGEQRIGDPWLARDFIWDVQPPTHTIRADGAAVLTARVLWKSPKWLDEAKKQKPIVQEETTIIVHPSAEDHRKIDFEIRLLAIEPEVRIGGSENEKGYGGFSARIRLAEDTVFTAKRGEVQPLKASVKAGGWVDVSGTHGEAKKISGVTILCHPSNPGYPHPWILRKRRSMQNAVYPGRKPVALSTETPLVLRYRLVLHRGPANFKQIESWRAERK